MIPFLAEEKLNFVYRSMTSKEQKKCSEYISKYCPELNLHENKITCRTQENRLKIKSAVRTLMDFNEDRPENPLTSSVDNIHKQKLRF